MSISSKTIVLIHGLFVNPHSWEKWIPYFEQKGYKVHAPAYPYHEGTPEALRKQSDPRLNKLNFEQVVKHYADFIATLPEKPILIGHSMGGLVAQKLIQMEKGVAAALIDGAAPMGIISFAWSFIKASFPVINPFKGSSLFMGSVTWFHYAFCNTMSIEETEDAHREYVVPESRKIAWGSLGGQSKINFKQAHAPLLFIAGEKDTIIPASLNKKNFAAYKDKNSLREFKIFPDRTHYICGQKGWEEVADYIQEWLVKL